MDDKRNKLNGEKMNLQFIRKIKERNTKILMKIRIQQPEDCSERAYDMVRNAYNWIL
jgi:hypothetical protein